VVADTSSWVGGDGLRQSSLCARGTRTLRRCSFDARSGERNRLSPLFKGRGKDRSTGVVGGQSAPSPAEKWARVIVRSAQLRVDFFSQAGQGGVLCLDVGLQDQIPYFVYDAGPACSFG
jgi:hypothetical protein